MNAAGHPARSLRAAAPALVLAMLAACGSDKPTALPDPGDGGTPNPSLACSTKQALAPGQSALLGPGQTCVELQTAGSRYMVGVINTSRTAGSTVPYEIVGRATAASGYEGPSPDLIPTQSWAGDVAARPLTDQDVAERRRDVEHQRILERTRGLRTQLGKPGRSGAYASPSTPGLSLGEAVAAAPTTGLRVIGDTATLRIPDINATNACRDYFEVKTRVVATTAHAILVEDVTAPLAGQMDATFQALGSEFEQRMWPVLTTNFGDPLTMDARLDANGKIVMLFSPKLNEKFTDIAGFVIGCDFYPRTSAPSSNEGEVFYAMVPTTLTGPVTTNSSRDGWLKTMRSTIIHEAKHITSYAIRFAADAPAEESWLEEGTARHAEEIYVRSFNGATWEGNTEYAAIRCEVWTSNPACTDWPYVMFKHYDALYDYMASNGTRTPLGKANADDYTFYASAWSLVRWAADLSQSEAAFFRALTRGPTVGVANLEAATGRQWPAIVADWTMALALDDYPGLAQPEAQKITSWNIRSVFAGMNADFASHYAKAYPIAPHTARFGSFAVQGSGLRGGSGALLELSGTWSGPQVVQVQLPGGGAPSSALRLVVTRIQ